VDASGLPNKNVSKDNATKLPILITIFNRPETTRRLVEALAKVRPEVIYVIADGARKEKAGETEKCTATRKIFDEIGWPCIVHKKFFDDNHGCDPTIEAGVNWLFENEETGIILEDDCVPDPTFFTFAAEMLEKYKDDTRVMHINGSNFQNDAIRGDGSYYFSRYSHSWGWATWRRAWQKYESKLKTFPEFTRSGSLDNIVQKPAENKFWLSFFKKIYEGKFPFWDSRWTYSIWSSGGTCITPNQNLIDNIGWGSDATHTGKEKLLRNRPVAPMARIVHPSKMKTDEDADEYTFYNYYYRNFWQKASYKLQKTFKSKFSKIAKFLTRGQLLWRINRKIRVMHRSHIESSANPNPSSYPYLSGDSFRSIATMIFDKKGDTVDPDKVQYGEIIFVSAERTEEFLRNKHPQISNPYILITHNGDNHVDARMEAMMDDKILKWFAMSVLVKNPKIIPIPAGLENLSYYHNGVTSFFDKFKKNLPTKKNRTLYGFTIATNRAERQPAYDFLSKSPLADALRGWPEPKKYLKTLRQYKFVASPPGNGIEGHRTWEAMYMRTVPIVKRSPFIEYFKSLGMPLLVIDNWTDLEKYSEIDLANEYEKLKSGFDNLALYMDYWIELIKNGNKK